MRKTTMSSAVCVAGGLLLASQGVYASVVDAINEFAAPSTSTWVATELGWFYTPTFDYQLGGIETKFRTSHGRSVAVDVYQDFVPGVGGTLLRTGAFVPVAEEFSGASFAELALVAGEPYFIGFQDMFELGANFTADAGATNLGLVHFSLNPGENYSRMQAGNVAQPIIRFLGPSSSVAEPTTLLLLGLGVLALGMATGRRFSGRLE